MREVNFGLFKLLLSSGVHLNPKPFELYQDLHKIWIINFGRNELQIIFRNNPFFHQV